MPRKSELYLSADPSEDRKVVLWQQFQGTRKTTIWTLGLEEICRADQAISSDYRIASIFGAMLTSLQYIG